MQTLAQANTHTHISSSEYYQLGVFTPIRIFPWLVHSQCLLHLIAIHRLPEMYDTHAKRNGTETHTYTHQERENNNKRVVN